MILGNSGPYDEDFESPFEISLIIFYILATLLLVIIMLNLLIAIVSDTNERVSLDNEFIYQKNRVLIIVEYLSGDINKEKLATFLKEKYLINAYNKKSKNLQEETNESEQDELKRNTLNLVNEINEFKVSNNKKNQFNTVIKINII